MKKLLSMMIIAIVVVSCKDKSEDPQPSQTTTTINYGTNGNCRYTVDYIIKDGICQYYGYGTKEIAYIFIRKRDNTPGISRWGKDTTIYATYDKGAYEEYLYYKKMNVGDCYIPYKK